MKAAQAYTASEAGNRRPSLEQAAEIARLQERKQLATKKEQQQQMKERDVAELRPQLQTLETAPAQKKVVSSVSKAEVNVIILLCSLGVYF